MKKLLTLLFSVAALTVSAQTLPYQNPSLTPQQRADDLLPRLTLEEKVRLMMDSSHTVDSRDGIQRARLQHGTSSGYHLLEMQHIEEAYRFHMKIKLFHNSPPSYPPS